MKMLEASGGTIQELYSATLRELTKFPARADVELSYESPAILELLPDQENGVLDTPILTTADCLKLPPEQSIDNNDTNRLVLKHYEEQLITSGRISKVIELLKMQPYTKRAIVNLWKNEPGVITDSDPCLMYAWFRQSDNGLDFHVHFRGNDAHNKLLLNLCILTSVHFYVAAQLSVGRGTYRHFIDSLHIYRKDDKYLKAPIRPNSGKTFK